ncbi:hypothetical protein ACN2XU_20655 [Primorskyibacter sp. 2E107]|uniref:hypothetical protein n=1 Tax=Primorskyibacter sp. 2E107 TaxID=3403458 RepID=UPI003AF94648
MRLTLIVLACLGLGACSGDPFAGMPRFGDVTVDGTAGQADALPDAAQADLTEVAPPVVATQTTPQRGFLGFLRRKAEEGQGAAAAEATMASVGEPGDSSLAEEREPTRARGLFGGFFRGDAEDGAAAREAVQEAALLPEGDTPGPGAPVPQAPESEPRGLFGGLFGGDDPSEPATDATPGPSAPDYAKVGPGVTLPHGTVARLCGVEGRSLGKKAESFPLRGTYTLFDSKPGSTEARNFYLSGFDDGCLRQFTAALVMFGSVESYEQIHYGAPGVTLPRSETDVAYEGLKGRLCGVARDAPCGSKISRLSGNTAFVSIYERFENNARWTTLLVHDGDLLAVDTKG